MQLKLIPIYLENKELFGMAGRSTEVNTVMSVKEYSERYNVIVNNTNNFDKKTIVHTNMADKNLVIYAISKYSERFEDEELLADFLDKGSISFNKSDNGTYDLIFYGYFSDEEMIYISNEIFDYYKKNNKNSIKNQEEKYYQNVNNITITTPMKDKTIISKVLSKLYKNNYIFQDISIEINLNENNTYDLVISGVSAEKSTIISNQILEEYQLHIQELNYNNIIKKLKEEKHIIESEAIDKNDSIILTVQI